MRAVCCNQCFHEIVKKDSGAGRLWLDLCTHRAKIGCLFRLREERVPDAIPHFITLEEMGYITTIDNPDGVILRVEGHETIGDEDERVESFCLHREEHAPTWQ